MMDWDQFFYPKSVVIVGSMGAGKLGAILAEQILSGGYGGTLSAVNPKGEAVPGVSGYASVASIPATPDLAVIVSPAPTVASVLDECGRAGVRHAVIITSGFAEAGNRAGEEEIHRIARQHGIHYVGPNCAGIANAGYHFFPCLEMHVPAGAVAMVSQSGALGGVVMGEASRRKLGFSKFVSYGNGSDLNQVDFLRYLARDDETKVVAVYIESIRDGREFMAALAECARAKPVLVIKAGRTQAGTRATASHTGSMAGSDAVYDAAIRASGAIRAASVAEMLDLCEGFVSAPLPAGKRVAIVTNSGGPGVLAADLAEELGLSIAEPGTEAQARLRAFLPGHCSLKNPIDLTVEGTESGYRETLRAALPEYDAAIAINVGTTYLDHLALARGVASGAAGSGKPVLATFVPEQLMDESKAYLQANGIPCFPSGERAAVVLARMARYSELRRRPAKTPFTPPAETRRLPGNGPMLEPEAMAWLRENGIPVPEFATATSEAEATAACERVGFPAVMKVVSPDILHKSDAGGVVVGIRDAEGARGAFRQVRRAAEGKDFRGAVVYPVVRDAQEVLLGLSTDPQFGPVVAFGLGGIYTEVFRDIVLRVAPVDEDEALEMIHSVKAVKLLQGARGKAPCDLAALAKTIARFSRLPFEYPEICEMDLNPVFMMEKGLVVGDVRIIRK